MVSGIQAFRIDFAGAAGPNESMAAHLARTRNTDGIQDRWRDVEQAGGFIHTILWKTPGASRPVNDEGHMQSALVNEITVSALAMISKALAMIGGEYDQRLLQKLTTVQERQKIPQNPIHVSELG